MPKNKVNNNIKLKSGGGIVNDATDGLSVDTGTTANKLVRLDSSAKLPAVDGSQLTNLPIVISQNAITATRNVSDNSASVTYAHGLGYTPNWVRITMMALSDAIGYMSEGYYNSSGQKVIYAGYYGSSQAGSNTNNIVELHINGSSDYCYGRITAVDNTNITISWTKVGNPYSNVMYLFIMAGK